MAVVFGDPVIVGTKQPWRAAPSEPSEPAIRPTCGKKMLLRFTGLCTGSLPEISQREWWCGCGHREPAPPKREVHPDDVTRRAWEALNQEPEGS